MVQDAGQEITKDAEVAQYREVKGKEGIQKRNEIQLACKMEKV